MTTRCLGGWIAVLTIGHAVLYVVAAQGAPSSCFYLDPRIGWSAWSDMLGLARDWPAPIAWLTVVCEGALAAGLLTGRVGLKAFRVTEGVLSVPSLAFFGFVAVINSSPSHGFSIQELLLPLIVFGLFSVVPFVASWWVRVGEVVPGETIPVTRIEGGSP